MICSGAIGQTIVPIIHDIVQVKTIYIFCGDQSRHEQWAEQWSKVKGVFTNITPICEALKQAVQQCNENTVSISFIATNDNETNHNLDQLDQSFMYTQILKEILLTINYEQKHIKEFITYCRKQFDGNPAELKNVDILEQEYHKHVPIWWHTKKCFLYSMLNRAIQLMEVNLIISMGFYIRDLHQHILQLHLEQFAGHTHSNSFIVYRDQSLTQTDFDQLVKTKGGLLSFNNFLSTSINRQVSLNFLQETIKNSDLVGILFVIKINPSKSSTPFANVRNVSYFQGEEEILFSMHSIFRIENIKQMNNNNNRLWQVELVLASNNDPQLNALTEHIRNEAYPYLKGWDRLGMLLIEFGEINKAQEVYNTLLDQTTSEDEKAHFYHMLGMIKDDQGESAQAITYYEKSIEISQKIFYRANPDLAASYADIGLVYDNMGEYSKALEIAQKTLPRNHPDLATSYNNIGLVYDSMGEYSKALSYYEKALEIAQKTLPSNHPDLGISYDNIGLVYNMMGEYSKALSYYDKALEIAQKTLPSYHPDLASSYNNIGLVYDKIDEYSKALSSHEKALEIYQKILPPNHPDLAISYDNIASVFDSMGEYSKALSSHEKALEIRLKALPPDHPDLAISYDSIGLIYKKMGEYSKALSSHEKAFEIKQKTIPLDHPSFATSYNNIGLAYDNMGEYSKALSYYEKHLEISQKTLPPNHPDLATSCNNIAQAYYHINDYLNAFSFIKRAIDIAQCSLPTNHPALKTYQEGLEMVKRKL